MAEIRKAERTLKAEIREVQRTLKAKIREVEFLAAGEACKATF